MSFWAYMLHCRGGTFYVGHTDDLERRMAQHVSGAFRGFTRDNLPVELVWSEYFGTREEARLAEKRIKGWSRKKKLALIRGDWEAISRLAKSKSSPSTSSGQSECGEWGIVVHHSVIALLRAEAARAHPREACGILFGEGRIEQAVACANVHPSPATHFEIDPAVLIAAHKAERAGGPAIAGYWHSHPAGAAIPSAADQASASGDGRVWAIVAGEAVTFWRDGEGGFEALSYTLADR
jgi:predicted GIY-YIG superfamily endonuclease/proteasome lid subunit RPN8/RPN11